MAKSLQEIFRKYISENIPRNMTNVLFQLFNGTEAVLDNLRYKLDMFKRERNILTAQTVAALRSLAAQNGFEPKLKTPATGVLYIKINAKLYSRVGFPLFIKPYSVFTSDDTKLNYYFVSDTAIKLSDMEAYVPVIEGDIVETSIVGTGDEIQRFYFEADTIAENSITCRTGEYEFQEVKSFFDNDGINDNRQFLIKFSNNPQTPIIMYIKGLKVGETLQIMYRLTSGENGNISGITTFTTEDIVDNQGIAVNPGTDEIEITNVSGFRFGSDGTDTNSLRAAIGYNHGSMLLFDNQSYNNFLGKFSTLLVQNITIIKDKKQINNIYVSKRQSVNTSVPNTLNIIEQYQKIVQLRSYYLTEPEKIELNKLITENEYCLASHNLYNSLTSKWALQITLDTPEAVTKYSEELLKLIYTEFSKFFYDINHSINFELLFDNFMNENGINLTYLVFNSDIEQKKLEELSSEEYQLTKLSKIETPYIIRHIDEMPDRLNPDGTYNPGIKQYVNNRRLPLLCGDFTIVDSEGKTVRLFNDVNISASIN